MYRPWNEPKIIVDIPPAEIAQLVTLTDQQLADYRNAERDRSRAIDGEYDKLYEARLEAAQKLIRAELREVRVDVEYANAMALSITAEQIRRLDLTPLTFWRKTSRNRRCADGKKVQLFIVVAVNDTRVTLHEVMKSGMLKATGNETVDATEFIPVVPDVNAYRHATSDAWVLVATVDRITPAGIGEIKESTLARARGAVMANALLASDMDVRGGAYR